MARDSLYPIAHLLKEIEQDVAFLCSLADQMDYVATNLKKLHALARSDVNRL